MDEYKLLIHILEFCEEKGSTEGLCITLII